MITARDRTFAGTTHLRVQYVVLYQIPEFKISPTPQHFSTPLWVFFLPTQLSLKREAKTWLFSFFAIYEYSYKLEESFNRVPHFTPFKITFFLILIRRFNEIKSSPKLFSDFSIIIILFDELAKEVINSHCLNRIICSSIWEFSTQESRKEYE